MGFRSPQIPFTPLNNGVHRLKVWSWRGRGRWYPAFAGMIGVFLVGCAVEQLSSDKYLVCQHELIGHEKMPLSVKLYDEVMTSSISKKAEVSYGVSPKSASYFETAERYTITLSKNDTFPECIFTIDRVSGFAKHLCLGKSERFPDDPRAQTFELTCKTKTEKI